MARGLKTRKTVTLGADKYAKLQKIRAAALRHGQEMSFTATLNWVLGQEFTLNYLAALSPAEIFTLMQEEMQHELA